MYVAQSAHLKADKAYRQSLRILEKALGPDDKGLAFTMSGLAELCLQRADFDEAVTLFALSELYRAQGELAKAQAIDQRKQRILERRKR